MVSTNTNMSTHERFQGVRAENSRGIFASEGPLFKGALFGRDSLEVAEDLVEFDDVIPKEVLMTLASLQGLLLDNETEEEPGKIHHEYRAKGDVPDEHSLSIFSELSSKWGGNSEEMVYYGTVDATPLFVRLATQYVKFHGDGILYEPITGRDGETRTFADHMLMAKDWIVDRIDTSEFGLIEYKRTNVRGIENQVWKDSSTGYTHINGEIVNYDSGVAALEVQSYAYDALKGIRDLFPGTVREGMVEDLGRRIINDFWLEEEQMFAQAIDRDSYGRPRQVLTPTSNSGLILDSEVLLDIPGTQPMVEATVRMLMGPDFLTPAGIRCRSLEFDDIVDFADYHGSYAVWFKETNDIINGFLLHGYEDEAKLLAQNLVTTVETLGEYYEFCFVDENGQIIPPTNQTGRFADKRCNIPERGQAWTISAFLRCLRLLNREATPEPAAA